MRRWRTADTSRAPLCGRCGERIPIGQPYQIISFRELKTRKFRCQSCAEGTVHDLDTPEVHATPSFSKPMALVGKVLADVRAMEAGQFSREVGEDDE